MSINRPCNPHSRLSMCLLAPQPANERAAPTHSVPNVQAALFALAVADVLLVNIWCHDIGREQGSGKPLMKTIFQVRALVFVKHIICHGI